MYLILINIIISYQKALNEMKWKKKSSTAQFNKTTVVQIKIMKIESRWRKEKTEIMQYRDKKIWL